MYVTGLLNTNLEVLTSFSCVLQKLAIELSGTEENEDNSMTIAKFLENCVDSDDRKLAFNFLEGQRALGIEVNAEGIETLWEFFKLSIEIAAVALRNPLGRLPLPISITSPNDLCAAAPPRPTVTINWDHNSDASH